MRFVEVIVNSPGLLSRSVFTYSVPSHFDPHIGDLVRIPFGSREMQGVVSRVDVEPLEGAKSVSEVIEPEAVLPWQVAIAEWIAEYYWCSLGDAIRLVLPPSVRRRGASAIRLSERWLDEASLSEEELALVAMLRSSGSPVRTAKARAALGAASLRRALATLTRRGIVERVDLLPTFPAKRAAERVVALNPQVDVQRAAAELKRAPKQRAVVEILSRRLAALGAGEGIEAALKVSELAEMSGCTLGTILALERKGIVDVRPLEAQSRPKIGGGRVENPPALTDDQEKVWQTVVAALSNRRREVFLLHGVTGSGKTEIYLRALAETLRLGRRGLIMVPEIALTPQVIGRFSSRVPGEIAIIHSGLSAGQLSEEWRRIRRGEANVVIGSRSAVFAPLSDLGLIVVDEEHEWTYKQEQTPCYHAREVALKLAELAGATVILGSATPDIESYHLAQAGRYRLLSLPSRVTALDPGIGRIVGVSADRRERSGMSATVRDGGMPQVDVVDMRAELRAGNRGIFSRSLLDGIASVLAANEQAILFINRRGTATLVLCRDCGHVLRCRGCDVALVYHGTPEAWGESGRLLCHRCNRQWRPPRVCPRCGGARIRYFGVGTERVETEVRRLFPDARVIRWDRDVAKSAKDHYRIVSAFANHEADVLVGTQTVAKGLDFPLVTLVGVIDADTAIHLPDLRAGERTFQLLTQVAGRAGRGELGGRVIVQTYTPDHYCIRAASHHDYDEFYRREIEFRRRHGYPPWRRLARLVYTHWSEERCQETAEELAVRLRREADLLGRASLDVIGPAPTYFRRVRGKSRWQILLWGSSVQMLLSKVRLQPGWMVDVDPVTLL